MESPRALILTVAFLRESVGMFDRIGFAKCHAARIAVVDCQRLNHTTSREYEALESLPTGVLAFKWAKLMYSPSTKTRVFAG